MIMIYLLHSKPSGIVKKNQRTYFSLIELLLVVTVLLIIASLISPSFKKMVSVNAGPNVYQSPVEMFTILTIGIKS